jgi:phthiodiolone/phenolphthiodiolone dimycocerosates ketoreductase
MADHLVGIAVRRFDFLDACNVLSAMAMKTKRLKLGSCVTDLQRKHPAVLAQTTMTLDHLSNGRAILGIGAGEAMNMDPYGIIF